MLITDCSVATKLVYCEGNEISGMFYCFITFMSAISYNLLFYLLFSFSEAMFI